MSGKGRGNTIKLVRNNHLIHCFIFKNIALFKGDTYVYRGIFKRNGGNYNKEQYGYLVSLENLDNVKNEISKMVSGFIIYKKGNEELNVEIQPSRNLLIDDDSKSITNVRFYEDADANCANNTSDNLII
jgi:hypothetical protein